MGRANATTAARCPTKKRATQSKAAKRTAPGKVAQASVLRAAKVWAAAYIKYGKELDTEEEKLVRAALKAWPQLKKLDEW